MPLLNPYCTVEQVQAELRNTEDDLEVQIEDAINQASRWIDDYKGKIYYESDYSVDPLLIDQFDSGVFNGRTMLLPLLPIIELTSVSFFAIVNGAPVTTLLVEDADYVLKKDRIISMRDHLSFRASTFWPLHFATDRVSLLGKFGYSQEVLNTDDPPVMVIDRTTVPQGLPDFINRAAVMAAAAFSGHNQKEIVGLDGAKTEVIDKTIPKTVFDILGSRKIVL